MDVNNRRIAKTVSTNGATPQVERFVYDGNNIALSFDGNGKQTHRYFYGAGVDQILADCSAYLLVSLHSEQLLKLPPQSESKFATHPWWLFGNGWNNILNNLRLIIQPFVLFNLIKPWLTVIPIPQLSSGFSELKNIINNLTSSIFIVLKNPNFYFSSA